jgi:hypothetical protein
MYMYIHWRERKNFVRVDDVLVAELTRSERRDGKARRVTVRQLGSIPKEFRLPNPEEHGWFGSGRPGGEFNYNAIARLRFWLRSLGWLVALCRDDAGAPAR